MLRILFLVSFLLTLIASPVSAFTVNNTLDLPDANPGDLICQASNGQCTLRAAIDEVNASGGWELIRFQTPGMVFTLSSLLTIWEDVTIEGFGAGFTILEGAGFDVLGANLTLKDLTVRDAGTAVRLEYDGEVVVEDCAMTGSTDRAIHASTGSVTLLNSTFSNNSTTGKGGAVDVLSPVLGTGLTVSGCEFTNNSASQGGGAIFFDLGDVLVIEDSVFDENSSSGDGGALLIDADAVSSGSISGCTLTDNSAFNGGGIFIAGDDVEIEIRRTDIGFNSGSNAGGGIFIDTTGTSTISLRDSSVYVNETEGDGGGLHSAGSDVVEIVNSTFSLNNAAADGGGIYLSSNLTGSLIYSSTITLNNADSEAAENNGSGGGLFVESGSGLVYVRNTILADNDDLSTFSFAPYAPDCSADVVSEGYNLIGYANFWCDTGSGGVGDLVGDGVSGAIDPVLGTLMMNAGWPTFAHPLLDGSSAIDAADPVGCFDVDGSFLVTDQVGRPRPVGGRGDIGAYEAGPPIHIFSDGFETGNTVRWTGTVN